MEAPLVAYWLTHLLCIVFAMGCACSSPAVHPECVESIKNMDRVSVKELDQAEGLVPLANVCIVSGIAGNDVIIEKKIVDNGGGVELDTGKDSLKSESKKESAVKIVEVKEDHVVKEFDFRTNEILKYELKVESQKVDLNKENSKIEINNNPIGVHVIEIPSKEGAVVESQVDRIQSVAPTDTKVVKFLTQNGASSEGRNQQPIANIFTKHIGSEANVQSLDSQDLPATSDSTYRRGSLPSTHSLLRIEAAQKYTEEYLQTLKSQIKRL